MKFRIGGKVHEPHKRLIRCDSETDGIVRMKEERCVCNIDKQQPLFVALLLQNQHHSRPVAVLQQGVFVSLKILNQVVFSLTEHTFYMQRAIALAKRGCGLTNPNPMVGAVIVKNGTIIGEGWHTKYGALHAERHALSRCTESPDGATMYVTLEPCCHHGKQPPCTEAVIQSGIRTVYVGSRDPNPLVSGKGVQQLRAAGITVHTDFLRAECDACNPFFFHYITTKLPYCIVKYAMTADGAIACSNGASKWVTGELARADVQQTRKAVAAILVGIGTVLADDPLLTYREEIACSPVRIVCDTTLRIPLESQLVQTAKEVPLVVMTCQTDSNRIQALERAGVTVCVLPAGEDGRPVFSQILQKIGEMGLDSVLIEGGAAIHAAALQSGMVQQVQIYLAPKLFGGDGLSPVGKLGITDPMQAPTFSAPVVTRLGQDIRLDYFTQ